MSEKYYHLSAEVHGSIVDLLVSEAEYADADEPEDFFQAEAKDVRNNGVVFLQTEQSNHVLPDQFG